MPHMDYAQIETYRRGDLEAVYESCGHDQCNAKILAALGVGNERFTDRDEFDMSADGDTVIVVLRHHMDEQDSCTWCFGCGDFLAHGLSCDCKERGHDPEGDREPLEPMVDVTGALELRPFK